MGKINPGFDFNFTENHYPQCRIYFYGALLQEDPSTFFFLMTIVYGFILPLYNITI